MDLIYFSCRVPGSRSGIRQRVHRATVAERDVRMFVSAGLRDGGAAGAGLGRVFHVLQPRLIASPCWQSQVVIRREP